MQSKSKRRYSNAKKQERDEKIKQYSAMIINDYGLDELKLDKICEHVGIVKGTYYNSYSSKDTMMQIFITEGIDNLIGIIAQLNADSTSLNGRHVLSQCLRILMQTQPDDDHVALLFLRRNIFAQYGAYPDVATHMGNLEKVIIENLPVNTTQRQASIWFQVFFGLLDDYDALRRRASKHIYQEAIDELIRIWDATLLIPNK